LQRERERERERDYLYPNTIQRLCTGLQRYTKSKIVKQLYLQTKDIPVFVGEREKMERLHFIPKYYISPEEYKFINNIKKASFKLWQNKVIMS
jgi:hypothetical protein